MSNASSLVKIQKRTNNGKESEQQATQQNQSDTTDQHTENEEKNNKSTISTTIMKARQLKSFKRKFRKYNSANNIEYDKILSQILKDGTEIINGYPTEHGLRKVFECERGRITRTEVEILRAEPNFAAVMVKVDTDTGLHYEAVGECSIENAQEPYSLYPVSMAETRAYSRLYRKALNIATVAAEEIHPDQMKSNAAEHESSVPNDWIIVAIQKKAKSLNINLDEFCKNNYEKSLEEMDKSELSNLYNSLNAVEK